MQEIHRPSISPYFARVAIARAIERGCEPATLHEQARLTDTLLADPRTRITAAQLGALYRSIWHTLNDETLGFGAEPQAFGTFALMARHTIHCADLREALAYSIQFYNRVSRALRWQLRERDGRVRLELQLLDPAQDVEGFLGEFMLLVWHRYFNWLIGTRIALVGTEFRTPQPAHSAEHRQMFPGPLHYDAPTTALVFDAAWLAQAVVRKRSELRTYLQQLPDDWFIKQEFDYSLSERLYQLLLACEGEAFPDMAELAGRWHTTTRTLHRHLKEENSSFRTIRDQVRRDKAITWLMEDNCTMGEIARRLHMTEPAFNRAFKGWTGLTPLVYRRSRASFST